MNINLKYIEKMLFSAQEIESTKTDIEDIVEELSKCAENGENVKIKYGNVWLYSLYSVDENFRLATGFNRETYLKIKRSEENKPRQAIVDFHRVWEKLYKKHIKDKFEIEAYREIEEYINSVVATYDVNQIQGLSIDMMLLAELMKFVNKGNLVENADRFKRIAKTPEERLLHPITYFITTSNVCEGFIRAFMEDVEQIYGSKDRRFVREVVDEYAEATKYRLFGECGQNGLNNKQKL